MARWITAPFLLGLATVVALSSFCSLLLFGRLLHVADMSWTGWLKLGLFYLPIQLGLFVVGLGGLACIVGRHKVLIAAYVAILAPFAFCYPAWMLLLWVLYATGRYHGAMP